MSRTALPSGASATEAAEIVWVAREFAPVTAGGIGALIRSAAERLDRKRFSATLLLDLPAPSVRRARDDLARDAPDVRVWGVDELADDRLPLHSFRSEAYWRSYRIWRALDRLCRESRPAAIEFADFEGLGYVTLKASRLGLGLGGHDAPHLWVRLHGTAECAAQADESPRAAPSLLQTYRMERYCLEHADALVSPSEGVTRWYAERYVLAGWVEHGVPPYERVGPGDEHRPPVTSGPLRLLFVGKLQPLKGVEALVRAAVGRLEARGEDALEVDLIGPDAPGGVGRESFRRALETLIPKTLVGRFHFHDRLDHEEIRRVSAQCHAAVFPSRVETFCLAAHELNWLGVPLLLSDIPAFRDHFTAERDALFFTSADGLESLLDRLLDDASVLEKLVWNAASLQSDPSRVYAEMLAVAPTCPPPDAWEARSAPRVSIVIPFYEMQDYVAEAIASVDASCAPNSRCSWEIVLVDDGSDSAAAVACLDDLERARTGDPRFRILRESHGGLGRARNLGIDAARGEFVLPLDADDRIHPDYLSRAVTALERRPELAFVSCIAAIFRDGRSPESAREWIVPYDPDVAQLLYENGSGAAACVFRRSLFEQHRYDESLPAYEDWDLQLGLARAGARGESIPLVLFYYRTRRGSLVRTRAHGEHDRLVARMLDKHFPDLAPELAVAFKTYVQVSSEMRGLGSGAAMLSHDGVRARLIEALRDVYLRWLKGVVVRRLSERRQRQLVSWAKRLIGASPEPPV